MQVPRPFGAAISCLQVEATSLSAHQSNEAWGSQWIEALVVFAEPEDMTLLGARTLEGLALVVDSRKKKLVAAGLLPAA
jgi:hypothetical protein